MTETEMNHDAYEITASLIALHRDAYGSDAGIPDMLRRAAWAYTYANAQATRWDEEGEEHDRIVARHLRAIARDMAINERRARR